MEALGHVRKLDRKLGVGAHGVVYLGLDESSGRLVAIKEIPYMSADGDGSGMEHDEGGGVGAAHPEDAANQILQELHVMQRFRQHENLVGYYGARRSSVGVQLVMEYLGGGSLERLMRLSGPLPEAVVRLYARDILRGLHCLHDEMQVCHRDVKPANVLLTQEGRCKLTDFGVSKLLVAAEPPHGHAAHGAEDVSCDADDAAFSPGHAFMQTLVGTPWYMAPEVIGGGETGPSTKASRVRHSSASTISSSCSSSGSSANCDDSDYYNPLRGISYRGPTVKGADAATKPSRKPTGAGKVRVSQYERAMQAKGYTTSADIWSVGVTVYEMISGRKPFGEGLKTPTAVLFSILGSASQPPKLPAACRGTVSRELRGFLDLCFVYDKALRPSALELLAHPWLAGLGAGSAGGVGDTVGKLASVSRKHSDSIGSQSVSCADSKTSRVSAPRATRLTPMLDAADLAPSLVPFPPGRRGSSASKSPSTSVATPSSCQGPHGRRPTSHRGATHSRPRGSALSKSGSRSSPSVDAQLLREPVDDAATRRHAHSPVLSRPPELPALPPDPTAATAQSRRYGCRPPHPHLPAKPSSRRSSRENSNAGFFALDGHYVDFIARIPSPTNQL